MQQRAQSANQIIPHQVRDPARVSLAQYLCKHIQISQTCLFKKQIGNESREEGGKKRRELVPYKMRTAVSRPRGDSSFSVVPTLTW